MEFTAALSSIRDHYQKNLPFVIYSEPGSKMAVLVKGDASSGAYSAESELPGFILKPFLKKERAFYISADPSQIFQVDLPDPVTDDATFSLNSGPEDKVQHMKAVESAVEFLKSDSVSKIVLSRRAKVDLKNFSIEALATSLFGQQPEAFRYLWFHPSTDIWCGASPELLLETAGKEFRTMALAGTQAYTGDKKVLWDWKEKQEQRIVVDGIVEDLENLVTFMKVSRAINERAGNVIHLRTDIRGVVKKKKRSWEAMAKVLHPTPAVCGTPTKDARKYIVEHENYPREFYTGYLGWVNVAQHPTRLYVNLRCMKLTGESAYLYAGGGITPDSVPESEWIETENKLNAMTQVLRPFL